MFGLVLALIHMGYWNPKLQNKITIKLLHLPLVSSRPHLIPGLLHATCALSILVKLGTKYIVQGQTFM